MCHIEFGNLGWVFIHLACLNFLLFQIKISRSVLNLSSYNIYPFSFTGYRGLLHLFLLSSMPDFFPFWEFKTKLISSRCRIHGMQKMYAM